MLIDCKGVLLFDPEIITKKHERQSSWKKVAIINVEDDTAEYYSWFLKKRFHLYLLKPLRGTHLTIINDMVEDVEKYNECLKKYNGKEVHFQYDPDVRTNIKHWWLKVICTESEEIRRNCGLSEKTYWSLHLTIGNVKEKNYWFSEYILQQILKFNL